MEGRGVVPGPSRAQHCIGCFAPRRSGRGRGRIPANGARRRGTRAGRAAVQHICPRPRHPQGGYHPKARRTGGVGRSPGPETKFNSTLPRVVGQSWRQASERRTIEATRTMAVEPRNSQQNDLVSPSRYATTATAERGIATQRSQPARRMPAWYPRPCSTPLRHTDALPYRGLSWPRRSLLALSRVRTGT